MEVLFPAEAVKAIKALHFPLRDVEDKLVWEHTNSGSMFSLKSAYLLRFEEAFCGVLRREQAHFKGWGKVWGLNIPPKYQMFVWKVIHRIIAVKDALIMRNIQVDPSCPVCGEVLETIERLFFECDFARRAWRASYLGFDFSKRNLVQFGDWFSMWLREAPNKEVVRDSIFMMWAIWCARNDALFNSNKPNVDCVLRCLSGISSLYRSTHVKMKQSLMGVTSSPITCGQTVEKSETCFLFDESGMDREVGVASSLVVDGAWLAATGVGASAWVQ